MYRRTTSSSARGRQQSVARKSFARSRREKLAAMAAAYYSTCKPARLLVEQRAIHHLACQSSGEYTPPSPRRKYIHPHIGNNGDEKQLGTVNRDQSGPRVHACRPAVSPSTIYYMYKESSNLEASLASALHKQHLPIPFHVGRLPIQGKGLSHTLASRQTNNKQKEGIGLLAPAYYVVTGQT